MTEAKNFKYTLDNKLSEIEKLMQEINHDSELKTLSKKSMHTLTICLDEVLNNIMSYSFPDGKTHHINVELSLSHEKFTLVIKDDGVAFNPLNYPAPKKAEKIEETTIGGQGIHLVKNLSDVMNYQRDCGYNVLTIEKKLS